MIKKVLIVSLVALLTCWGGVAAYLVFDFNNRLEAQNQTITKLQNDTSSTIDELNKNVENLEKEKTELQGTVDNQKKLLESRENFLAVLPLAKDALARTENKIDPAPYKQKVLDAQNVVAEEKTNPENINTQTQNVKNTVAEIDTALQTYDAEQDRARQEREQEQQSNNNRNTETETETDNGSYSNNSDSGNSGGGSGPTQSASGLDVVRQALNDVGGGWVRLGAAPVVCGVEWAVACADPSGYIEVDSDYLGRGYNWWYKIMMHEYAHQIQFPHYDQMVKSPTYQNLFGGNIEWAADCMAAARIPGYYSGYGYSCNADQLNYGANAWNGNF